MLFLDEFGNGTIDAGCGFRRACECRVSAEVLVRDGFHSDHAEFITHAEACDHGSGKAGSLFDIVGSAACGCMEYDFFSCAAAGQGSDLVFHFFLAHEVMVAFFDLHRVAESAACTRNDCDLLDRSGMCLHGSHESVADFMVCDDAFFLVCQDRMLLLVACNDDFDGFFHVFLRCDFSVVADSAEGCFVHDVRKLSAGCAGSHARYFVIINIRSCLDLGSMDLEDFHAALKVWEDDRHLAVETARTGQCGVEGFRTVCCRQNDDACVFFEAVHLGEELVQRLFTFIIAADGGRASLLADGIDFIDEYDTWCFFLRLLEEVSDLGCAHADEHFYEFRTGNGEERYVRFPCDCLGQHGLACAWRSDEEDALRHLRADFLVLGRIVEVFDDFLQAFLRFIFTGYIGKADAVCRFDEDLRIGFAEAELHGSRSASHVFHETLIHVLADPEENQDREYPAEQDGKDRVHLVHDLSGECDAGIMQTADELRVIHESCLVSLLRVALFRKEDLVLIHFDLVDLLLIRQVHECRVVDFLHLLFTPCRHDRGVEQNHQKEDDDVVHQDWLLR